MKNATKKDSSKNEPAYADLGVLYDGAEDEDSEPAPEAVPVATTPVPGAEGVRQDEPADRPAARAQVPEVIYPHQYRLRTEFDYKPGEDGWGYLDRITPHLLKELVAMATAPVSIINAKVKLDALKELIQRPMPARQVYDIRTPAAGSEFDRMSDAQVMDFVHKQITDMRREELTADIATAPADSTTTPEDTTPEE
jgi:hypothetical protein